MTTLNYVRGDTFTYTATVTVTQGGAAQNLTGTTLWFTIKRAKDEIGDLNDAAAIVKCYWVSGGVSSGITVAMPSNGQAVITVAPAVTATLDPRLAYVWDLQWQTATGAIETIDSGTLSGSFDVTQRITAP